MFKKVIFFLTKTLGALEPKTPSLEVWHSTTELRWQTTLENCRILNEKGKGSKSSAAYFLFSRRTWKKISGRKKEENSLFHSHSKSDDFVRLSAEVKVTNYRQSSRGSVCRRQSVSHGLHWRACHCTGAVLKGKSNMAFISGVALWC